MHATSIAQQPDGTAGSGQNADQLRQRLHEMWGEVADGWGEHSDSVDRRSAPLTQCPFSLEHADALAALLADARLSGASVTEMPVPLRAHSFEEWWTARCTLAGPLTKVLASLPEEAATAIRTRAQEAARPYETTEGLEVPGVALIAGARRE